MPFSSNGGFVNASPPVASPVINNYIGPIFLNTQPLGASWQAGDTTPSQRQSPTEKITPGRVLGEDESSPDEPAHKAEIKDEDEVEARLDKATALKTTSSRRTLKMSYFRPRQGFFASQAILDPATSVNWVSKDVVQGFPTHQFILGRRMEYESSDRCRFESDKSIIITWRCSSGKTFDSDFRVLHMRGGSSISRAPDFVFGRTTLEEHEVEIGYCPLVGSGKEVIQRPRQYKPPTLAGGNLGFGARKTRTAFAASVSVDAGRHRVSKPRQGQRRDEVVHPGRLASWLGNRRQVRSDL